MVAIDVCLQCGKSRAQVKDPYDYPCATAAGYEVLEGLDDWERHHWRDWSDAELRGNRILPEHFEAHRRDDIYALGYAPCTHTERGHNVSAIDEPEFGMQAGQCWACGAKNLPIPELAPTERNDQ